jgi:glycerophosphoryl diester phosphodiesterase
MTAVIALRHARGLTRLKWHRCQRHASDAPFTALRIREGFAAGASFEVDLNVLADGGLAVLHDPTLDRETTGTGPVSGARTADLAGLRMRRPDGSVTDDPVLTLAGLAAMAEGAGAGLCQLDLKAGAAEIGPEAVAGARVLAPVAARFTVSGGDAVAVARLAGAVPGLSAGYDPCHPGGPLPLAFAGDMAGFVARTCAAVPGARLIYLDYGATLALMDLGHDPVARFQDEGCEVDAWTLDPEAPGAGTALARLLEAGVDQITTSAPERLAEEALRLGLADELRA